MGQDQELEALRWQICCILCHDRRSNAGRRVYTTRSAFGIHLRITHNV